MSPSLNAVAFALSLTILSACGQDLLPQSCSSLFSQRNGRVNIDSFTRNFLFSGNPSDICTFQCTFFGSSQPFTATACCDGGTVIRNNFLAQFGITSVNCSPATPEPTTLPQCNPAPPLGLCPTSAVRNLDVFTDTEGVCSYGCYQRRRSFAGSPIGPRVEVQRYGCSVGYTMTQESFRRYSCQCTSSSCSSTSLPTTTEAPSTRASSATTQPPVTTASTAPPTTVTDPVTTSSTSTSPPVTSAAQLPICTRSPRVFTSGTETLCQVACRRGRGSFAGISFGPFTESEHLDCCTGYERTRNPGRQVTYTCEPVSN